MTDHERSEMYHRIEEWDRARFTVDEYVRNYYPFTSDQIVEFMNLESEVFSAALKLCQFALRLHKFQDE